MTDTCERADAELVELTRGGQQEAYKELIGRYQGHVYGLAYSLVNNWAEAQDIAQETFIRAYTNLDQIRRPERFAAWLRRVAFGVSMNWLRSFRPGLFEQLDGRVDLDHLEIPDFQPDPPAVAERRELANAVLAAIASLPARYRVPLTMFHLDGLSYQKVADFLDIPLGTVKGLIHRARAKLKATLAASEQAVPEGIQEVLSEYKLPPEFSREVWGLCMDWLCTGDTDGSAIDAAKQENIALAAARDPDVATVNEWRTQAEPIPEWALKVDVETPHWGVETCSAGWVEHLRRQVWMIANETALADRGPGWCGTMPATRPQWGLLAAEGIDVWLSGHRADDSAPAIQAEICQLLGETDEDKKGAAALLRDTIRLAVAVKPKDFDDGFKKLEATGGLAGEMRKRIAFLQFGCGYRWEKIVVELCRAIGDAEYRQGRPRAWHVGTCNGQVSFAPRDDPGRIPTTAAYLVGLWAWLKDVPADVVASAYSSVSVVAEDTRRQLGEMTPVKRWLAGRLFVGIRIWLQEFDHGDLKPPAPALDTYPALTDA
ncbi:MAG: RNA polymerase sigma factor [Planctomycetota bacterium]|jgi:RNA polymerase sigma-70 factor (ECF subfamily)